MSALTYAEDNRLSQAMPLGKKSRSSKSKALVSADWQRTRLMKSKGTIRGDNDYYEFT